MSIWAGHMQMAGLPHDADTLPVLAQLEGSGATYITIALRPDGTERALVATANDGHGVFHCVMPCPEPLDEQVARAANRLISRAMEDGYLPSDGAVITAAHIARAVAGIRIRTGPGTPGEAPMCTLSEELFG